MLWAQSYPDFRFIISCADFVYHFQILLCLDENYSEIALSIIRVPQILLQKICQWFYDNSNRGDSQLQCSSPQHSSTHLGSRHCHDIVEEITNHVLEFYATKRASMGLDIETDSGVDDLSNSSEPLDTEESHNENEKKVKLPLHIVLSKKVCLKFVHDGSADAL